MEQITNSRAFLVWRWTYLILLLLVSVPASFMPSPDIGPQLGYMLLALGVAPLACFLFLNRVRPRWACVFLLVYDVLVLLAFCAGLIVMNAFGFLMLSPLAGFAIEGLVLLSLFRKTLFPKPPGGQPDEK